MKKIYLLMAVALMLTASFVYAEPAEIRCDPFYTGTILASGTANTEQVDLVRKTGYEGYFSIQPIISGTGVFEIDYQINNGGGWFSVNAVEIVSPVVNGTIYRFPAAGVNMFGGYMRFVLTETGTTNPITITSLNLCRQ